MKQKAHSAYMVWRIKVDRAIQKVVPSLGKKSSAQLIFSIVMIVLTVMGTIGAGIYIDGYVIHPPQQYTGLCPPPAFIRSGNCLTTQTVTITRSGTEQLTTTQVPAGQILLPNETSHTTSSVTTTGLGNR